MNNSVSMKQASNLLLALSAAFLVTACGGSGSATTDTTAAAATPTPTPSPAAAPTPAPTPAATPSPAATPTPTPAPTPTPTPTPAPTPTPTSVYRLVGSYDKTECVFDSSTGLTWEGKPTSGFRVNTNMYSNYDDVTQLQKGSSVSAVMPTQAEVDAATNTIGYMNAVNAMSLCGYSDWRVPSFSELDSININTWSTGTVGLVTGVAEWFPNTSWGRTWTSTQVPSTPYGAKTLSFGYSTGHFDWLRRDTARLRLVR